MKKELIPMMLTMGLTVASCSDSVLQEPAGGQTTQQAITFDNILTDHSTRTSLSGSNFPDGAVMAVWGFQDASNLLFNDQTVTREADGQWTYSPLKYWNAGSTYAFYAMYPQTVTHTFDQTGKNFTIPGFTVADAIADQTDLMIAQENTPQPFNLVTMTFNHILCNVNFYAQIVSTLQNNGVTGATINSLTITGIKNQGTFTQNGFDTSSKVANGAWSNYATTTWTSPTITATPVDFSDHKNGVMGETGNVLRDMLLLPQQLSATLTVKYTLAYNDGTTTTFDKSLPLESILYNGTPLNEWKYNTIYNYIMTLDPTHREPGDFTDVAIDWDGTYNGDCEPTPNSKLEGPDANGDYVVVVTDDNGNVTDTYPTAWEDVDGDGKLELGVDRDGDGHIDNVDDENTTSSTNQDVSDGKLSNPDGKDVILIDTTGDGKPDKQIEKDPGTGDVDPILDTVIRFSATVENWKDEKDVEVDITQ